WRSVDGGCGRSATTAGLGGAWRPPRAAPPFARGRSPRRAAAVRTRPAPAAARAALRAVARARTVQPRGVLPRPPLRRRPGPPPRAGLGRRRARPGVGTLAHRPGHGGPAGGHGLPRNRQAARRAAPVAGAAGACAQLRTRNLPPGADAGVDAAVAAPAAARLAGLVATGAAAGRGALAPRPAFRALAAVAAGRAPLPARARAGQR